VVYDLEAYHDEVFTTVSLAHLQELGQMLGLEPATILVGDGTPPMDRKEYRYVVDGLQRRMASESLDAETLGERLGWDIRGLLEDPEELWKLNVTGLRDICQGVGIDWLAVLPRMK
jgi:hypothetical protein